MMEEDIDGCIQSIHVKNFFCHDNLEINLNRNVNFIVGRNGSGKSAILTALVVGLGARASATNRGNALHSFIKKGANSASIEITIKNNSAKAFKHEDYGDFITIVRNIHSASGSTYKVKSATGEVKSTKLEDVQAIILAHDIQVDNPISVLNQDDARSFHASDAKKKYSLFRRATNLDQSEKNYMKTQENCKKATTTYIKKNEACAELEKAYKKLHATYEQLQSRDEVEATKQALQNEYYWSEIADLERRAASEQAQYEKRNATVLKLVGRLSKMENSFGSDTGALDALKSQLEENKLQNMALEQELSGLEAEVRDIRAGWRTAQAAFSNHQELFNRERRKITDLEREIHSIDTGAVSGRRAELEASAARAGEAAAAATARCDTAKNDASQARAHAERAQAHADHATQRAHKQRDSIKQLKQQLRELQSRGNESLAVYGNNMVELVKRVQQATARGEFSAPPRGPLGSYLKVKEKKWSGTLEHIIGGAIQNFCVNTQEDSRKLFEIMSKVYGNAAKPGVTCSKFLNRAHDIRGKKVRARGYTCALDALDAPDPVVVNYLIDGLSMETLLLVPTHDEAVRLSDTVENVPENCKKIVTMDCSEFFPAPNYRTYGGVGRTSRFLHQSTDERKRQVQTEIQELETGLRGLEEEAERLDVVARQARDDERLAGRTLQAMMREQHERQGAAQAAATALEQYHTPHRAVLMDELNISKEMVATLQAQADEIASKERQLMQEVEDYDVRIKKIKNKLTDVKAAFRNLNAEIDQEALKLDRGAAERLTCQQRLKEARAGLAQAEAEVAERRALVSAKTDAALVLCPPVDNPRDLAIVTNELKKTEQKLNSIRSDGKTKEQVTKELLEVEKKFRSTRNSLQRLQKLIDQLKKSTAAHLKYCHAVQTNITRKVEHSFQSILTVRGYSGSMNIDNVHGVLEIKCTGRESSAKRHASSTSSLSGGERSYSTVAFVMALWDCVELPFYFLDEFDVFMDNVNRKLVMDLLVDHALKNPNRQFVFLTPQDTAAVNSSPQISIHLMADPRP